MTKVKNSKPKLLAALLCDRVITDQKDGGHTLVGLFSEIKAHNFPARHHRMVFFCGWLNNNLQENEGHPFRVNLKGPDGSILANIKGEIEFKKDKTRTFVILNFAGIMFKSQGVHKFVLYLDEEKIIEVPFKLIKVKKLPN
jgi:hypothetical protein